MSSSIIGTMCLWLMLTPALTLSGCAPEAPQRPPAEASSADLIEACEPSRWPPRPSIEWVVSGGWAEVFAELSPAPRLWPPGIEASGVQRWAWLRWSKGPQVAQVEVSLSDGRSELRRSGWLPWDEIDYLNTWWAPLDGIGLCLSDDLILSGELRSVRRLLDEQGSSQPLSLPSFCAEGGAALSWRRSGIMMGLLRSSGADPERWPSWAKAAFCQEEGAVDIALLLPSVGRDVAMIALQEAWGSIPGPSLEFSCRELAAVALAPSVCVARVAIQPFALRLGLVARWLGS